MSKPTMREQAEAWASGKAISLVNADDLMVRAYCAGYAAALDRAAELAEAEALTGALELTAWMGLPEHKRAKHAEQLALDVAARIRAEKERV